MRMVVYNIRYAMGAGTAPQLPMPGAGYLFGSPDNLENIITFIQSCRPDVVGLLEVDVGSVRSGRVNQAEAIAEALGHYSCYQCKYGEESLNQVLPILNKQANAFLAAPSIVGERFHYFDTGIKRLIIELELDDVVIFLVHLSLRYRQRQAQLRSLYELVARASKPVIVAGDFNAYWGENEMFLFMKAAGLRSANTGGLASYPSRNPRMELDFILYSEGIAINSFDVPRVAFSDHLPLVCDFELR